MKVNPIKKQYISDQVFEQLQENLFDGVWKPGEKIPSENELAAAFGVSRITVRQALSRLTALGLIETRLGEGSFVAEPNAGMYMQDMMPIMYLNSASSRDSTREMLEFRLIYEVEAAGFAAIRITEENIARLKISLDNMREYRNTMEQYIAEDMRFHKIIAEATDNSLVMQLNGIMQNILFLGIKDTVALDVDREGIKHHQRIIEAFDLRDSDKAKNAMREHLTIALNIYVTKQQSLVLPQH